MSKLTLHTLGYPRIGDHRELKTATEAYWQGRLSLEELEQTGANLRRSHWLRQLQAGIDLIPCGDFSFYDHVLDTTCMLGNIPPRFHWNGEDAGLPERFLIARGAAPCSCSTTHHPATPASEMTKWFDTNYHYIVPEFSAHSTFRLASSQLIRHFNEARALNLPAKPVLLGPVTYLTLGKVHDPAHPDFNRFHLFDRLLPVYLEILRRLKQWGASWVQIDEPILALDLTHEQKNLLTRACAAFKHHVPHLRILLASYFGELRDNLDLACSLDCDAFHHDAVRAPAEIETLARRLPPGRILSLGLIDGRNIWKTDLAAALTTIRHLRAAHPERELWLAPSCSLLHCPISLRLETTLDPEIKSWLAFADEKLAELALLRDLAEDRAAPHLLLDHQTALQQRRTSPRIHHPAVQARLQAIQPGDTQRNSPFPQRQPIQRAKLRLPPFPTTTIGSFPQTAEVRATRAKLKKGQISPTAYDDFIADQIRQCLHFQEEIGIDLLVHGEFERNDMVEYFGEQLEGFAFTTHGWVQSYGSRCVKPPIIFGDVSRPRPMTTRWSQYAQSLTSRPVKGMLTGPVTILQWSFVRDDQPRHLTARQIALALRDEVADLERLGLAAIQIDEPAFREGLPLRRADWDAYLRWAVEAFRLSAAVVRDDTQIHTHMCYSEFNDIIRAIADLDADVITIETSRSNMELLDAFVDFRYPAEIGPGVYDIHSPRVPTVDEIEALLRKAAAVLPPDNLWVNPDCGLKTRQWPEVRASLTAMVEAARRLRAQPA